MITKLQYVEFLISTIGNFTGTHYSCFIELVRLQYSGAEHGLVRGIGVVNLAHSSGKPGDFFPVDYRIYDPDADGKTKNDHFREMLLHAVADKLIKRDFIVRQFLSCVTTL